MSAGWTKLSEKKFGPELDDEYVIETSYKFQIWPFLSLTPDPQLLLDSAPNPDKWLAIHLIHSTRAMCPSGPLDKAPKKDLGDSAIYFFKDGFSYLDLNDNIVTMKFARQNIFFEYGFLNPHGIRRYEMGNETNNIITLDLLQSYS